MAIVSFEYLKFLIITAIIWYSLDKFTIKRRILLLRNVVLLILCLIFYSAGNIGGLLILIFQIAVGYFIGKIIGNSTELLKKALFIGGIIINLLIIALFKYFNFFLQLVGLSTGQNDILMWLTPLGVSFYSLEIIAYLSMVYHKKIKPEFNAVDFALFVSFFPTILSGPIERPEHIIPQIKNAKPINWSHLFYGSRKIISGFFRKMVIADQLAIFTDEVFNNVGQYRGFMCIVAVLAYTIQIYCDFSGYSEIAIGSAQILGINVQINFDLPYFSKSIKEFWRKWHISLSSWLRDYLYIPLGGNKHGLFRKCLNTFIVFVVSGLWHGAGWTFILWGAIHGIYMVVETMLCLDKKEIVQSSSFGRTIITFLLVAFAWIPFRANSISDCAIMLNEIALSFDTISSFSIDLENIVNIGIDSNWLLMIIISLIVFLAQEWYRKMYQECLNKYGETNVICSVCFSLVLVVLILLFGVYGPMYSAKDFIYFQF